MLIIIITVPLNNLHNCKQKLINSSARMLGLQKLTPTHTHQLHIILDVQRPFGVVRRFTFLTSAQYRNEKLLVCRRKKRGREQ
jgi:hypothetical protein